VTHHESILSTSQGLTLHNRILTEENATEAETIVVVGMDTVDSGIGGLVRLEVVTTGVGNGEGEGEEEGEGEGEEVIETTLVVLVCSLVLRL